MPELPSTLLFSLENLKIFRDLEIFTETYFVTLGTSFDVQEAGACSPKTDNAAAEVSGEVRGLLPGEGLGRWFHVSTTPIFRLRRNRRHVFPGGLPLYYSKTRPGTVTSVYLAVMESDRRARDVSELLAATMAELPTTGAFVALQQVTQTDAPDLMLLKQAFGLLVKVVEQALINNHDDICYTNVFSFKPSNDYLRGRFQVGSHKVSLTLSSEV